MRRALPPVLFLAVILTWVACDSEQPTGPADVEAAYYVSDGGEVGSASNFHWLPPIDDPPSSTGDFDGTLPPRVEICEWNAENDGGCAGEVLATYTRSAGHGTQRVGVDVAGQHYHLNWDTDELEPEPAKTYRIRVSLFGEVLGWADVQFFATGQLAKNLRTDEIIPLNDGRTLPIKFRIDEDPEKLDLAFHRRGTEPNQADIYLANSGTGQEVLLKATGYQDPEDAEYPAHPDVDATPSWSPDGTKIAFTCIRGPTGVEPEDGGGSHALCVMDADGTSVEVVTRQYIRFDPSSGLGIGAPAWSPDGKWIVFQGVHDWGVGVGEDVDLFLISADARETETPTRLTTLDPPSTLEKCKTKFLNQAGELQSEENRPIKYEEWDPTWTPEGTRVTFSRSHVGGGPGFVIGPPPFPPIRNWEYDSDCVTAWDFDVFSLDPFAGDLDAIRASEVNHTNNPDLDQNSPAWSPDGQYLLYSAADNINDDEPKHLWAMRASDGKTTQLTFDGFGENQEVDFSPGGERIVFTRYTEGGLSLYLADWSPDGPALVNITLFNDNGGWGRWRR